MEERRAQIEAVNFKQAKAQSKFIEIMRELHRFRSEFNETYSIRSKMRKTHTITTRIDDLIQVNKSLIVTEEGVLTRFQEAATTLYNYSGVTSKTVRQKIMQMSFDAQEEMSARTVRAFGQEASLNDAGHEQPSLFLKINNVKCFVNYSVDKTLAECQVKIYA